MSTGEQDLLTRLLTQGQAPAEPTAPASPAAPDVIHESGFIPSVLTGAAQGLLEPLGFLPPVRSWMDTHVDPNGGHMDPRGNFLGHALGFLAGFALPAGLAYKAVGYGAQAIRLVESADALAELSAAGQLARGAVVGSILGAGQAADSGEDRLKNMAGSAAAFGLGDVAIHGVARAYVASGLGGKISNILNGKFQKLVEAPIDESGANLLGDALKVANTFIDEPSVAKSGLGPRKASLLLGLEKAGFDNMRPGQVAILPGFGDEAGDVRGLLRRWKDMEYKTVSYVSKIDGSLNEDILVARKGELPEKLVSEYKRNAKEAGKGFVTGQTVRWEGADFTITGLGREPGTVRGYIPGRQLPANQMTEIPLKDASVMPMAVWKQGPASVPGAASLWAKFVEQHGQFPEKGWIPAFEDFMKGRTQGLRIVPKEGEAGAAPLNTATDIAERLKEKFGWYFKKAPDWQITEPNDPPWMIVNGDAQVIWRGFSPEQAAQRYLAPGASVGKAAPVEKLFDAAQVSDLKNYFAARTMESLGAVDKPLMRALANIKALQGFTQPETTLAKLAAQHGYVTYPDALADGTRVTAVRDVMSGRVEQFTTVNAAKMRISREARDLPDFIPPGVEPPIPWNEIGFRGTSVLPAHSGLEITNWTKMPKWLVGAHYILPRYAWMRMAQEVVSKELGGMAPEFYGPFTRLVRAMNLSRLSQQPYAEELKGIWDSSHKISLDDMAKMTAYMEEPSGFRKLAAEQQGLSPEHRALADKLDGFIRGQLKIYMGHKWPDLKGDKNLDELVTNFLDDYYYRFIRLKKPSGSGAGNWEDAINAHFEAQGRKPLEPFMELARDMERTGLGPGRFENNPFMTALRFMTTVHSKIHVNDAFNEVRSVVRSLPDTGNLQLIKKSLEDYLTASYSGAPEAYYVMRKFSEDTFKSLGIELEPKDFDKLVNTMVSLNYGAFMAFRPALAVRNMVQTLSVTLPMIQDPWAMAVGVKRALTTEGRDMAREAGAIPIRSAGQPMEDQQFRHFMAEKFAARGAKVPQMTENVLRTAEKFGQWGLGTEPINVGGRKFWIGFYSRADELNRAIAFHAQRAKTIKALGKFHSGLAHGDEAAIDAFNKKAGLTFFGDATTKEFHRIANTEGRKAAIDWLGTQAANETQWVYQMGAGPTLFSHGVGRLFGMYGTWPSWYAAHLTRGFQRFATDPVGAAKFWGWTAAVWGAVPAIGAKMGLNFTKWSGLSSFTWTGGPIVDVGKDITDVISGAGDANRPPTAGRLIALSKYGLKDYGNQLLPYIGYLDPRSEHGFDVNDPTKMVMQALDYFTPGVLAAKDIMAAPQQSSLKQAILKSMGFQPIVGQSWPSFNIR